MVHNPIVWGDSHASAIVTAVQAALQDPRDGVLGMSYTSCPTLFGVRQERPDLHCAVFNEWAMQQMAQLPADIPVLIVNRASAYLYGNEYGASTLDPKIYFDGTQRKLDKRHSQFLQEFADHYVASVCRVARTRPVYLLRPFPEMPADVPRTMARAAQLGRPLQIGMPLAIYHRRNATVWAAQDRAAAECGAKILNPLPLLCTDGVCQGMDGKVPRYYDDNHLSNAGNKNLIPLFASLWDSAAP